MVDEMMIRAMNPQPPQRVRRLIRQNDGAFVEATEGDMPLTGDWQSKPPWREGERVEREGRSRAIAAIWAEQTNGQWFWNASLA